MRNGGPKRRGFTLLEVVIASVILVALIGFTLLLVASSSATYESQNLQLTLDQRGRDTLIEIARELRMSTMSSLVNGQTGGAILPNDVTTYTNLRFKIPGTWDFSMASSPSAVMNQTVGYQWALVPGETANGADDNANGLVDEGVVERIEGTNPARRMCFDVKNVGLSFKVPSTNPGRVEIVLDLEVMDRKRVKLSRRVETTVELRN